MELPLRPHRRPPRRGRPRGEAREARSARTGTCCSSGARSPTSRCCSRSGSRCCTSSRGEQRAEPAQVRLAACAGSTRVARAGPGFRRGRSALASVAWMTVPWMTSPPWVADAGHADRREARESHVRVPARNSRWVGGRTSSRPTRSVQKPGIAMSSPPTNVEAVPARVRLARRSRPRRAGRRMAASPALRMMAKPIGMPATRRSSIQPQPMQQRDGVGRRDLEQRVAEEQQPAAERSRGPPVRPSRRAPRRRTRVTLSSTPHTVTRHSASATILLAHLAGARRALDERDGHLRAPAGPAGPPARRGRPGSSSPARRPRAGRACAGCRRGRRGSRRWRRGSARRA